MPFNSYHLCAMSRARYSNLYMEAIEMLNHVLTFDATSEWSPHGCISAHFDVYDASLLLSKENKILANELVCAKVQ